MNDLLNAYFKLFESFGPYKSAATLVISVFITIIGIIPGNFFLHMIFSNLIANQVAAVFADPGNHRSVSFIGMNVETY